MYPVRLPQIFGPPKQVKKRVIWKRWKVFFFLFIIWVCGPTTITATHLRFHFNISAFIIPLRLPPTLSFFFSLLNLCLSASHPKDFGPVRFLSPRGVQSDDCKKDAKESKRKKMVPDLFGYLRARAIICHMPEIIRHRIEQTQNFSPKVDLRHSKTKYSVIIVNGAKFLVYFLVFHFLEVKIRWKRDKKEGKVWVFKCVKCEIIAFETN